MLRGDGKQRRKAKFKFEDEFQETNTYFMEQKFEVSHEECATRNV